MAEARIPLSDKLSGGAGVLSAWVSTPEAIVAGHLAQEDFGAIVLDMQHGQVDIRTAIAAIAMVTLTRKPVIVRIPVADYALASQMLDAGALGIIAPMINSADDARKLVEFTKYPPKGQRSWGPSWALAVGGWTGPEYFKEANRHTMAIPMIETASALAQLDDILAVDGVDGVFVGPSDLSIALTNGAGVNPRHAEVDKAMVKVVERCRAHKKSALVLAGDGPRGKELLAMGFDLVALGPDFIQLREGARAAIKVARG